jgi:hypothetical protein
MGILVEGNYETPHGVVLPSVYVSLHNSVILYDKSVNRLIYTYNIYKDKDSAYTGKRPLDSTEITLETTDYSNVFASAYTHMKTLFPTFTVTDAI